MGRRTHLIVVDTVCSVEEITPIIRAQSSDKVHISVLVLGLAPEMPVSTYSASAYGADKLAAAWQEV